MHRRQHGLPRRQAVRDRGLGGREVPQHRALPQAAWARDDVVLPATSSAAAAHKVATECAAVWGVIRGGGGGRGTVVGIGLS